MFQDFKDLDYGDLLKFVNRLVKEEDQLMLSDIFDAVDHRARVGNFVM